MKTDIFATADILLPEGISMENWSVIACDQFSSERDYWERVRGRVGEEPSTLNLIIPEAYLGDIDESAGIRKIGDAMENYAGRGLLQEIKDSFIYVVRTLPDGRSRRGLIGAVDLDEYAFSGGDAAILASEGTVLERLPTRISIRRAVRYELPHIIAFINDSGMSVIEPLSMIEEKLPLVYDFDLMEGGGHIRGRRVSGADAEMVAGAMRALNERDFPLMVVGDGNHSLAAAKVYWDELKQGMDAKDRPVHPAGRALLEINNVFDPAIDFEAIHRVIFNVDRDEFMRALSEALPAGGDYGLKWVSNGQSGDIGVAADCIGDMLTVLQEFLDGYASRTGCGVDYIHGADAVARLVERERSVGLILPPMDKSELFRTVAGGRVFPKKSFSVGHARDKRYYLECREIINR